MTWIHFYLTSCRFVVVAYHQPGMYVLYTKAFHTDGDATGLLRVEGNVTKLERVGAELGLMSDHITLDFGVGMTMGTGFLG